jgi:hypothetical protein
MSAPTPVIDAHSNHEEFVERISKFVGRSVDRQRVFEAVYGRHKNPITFDRVKEIVGLVMSAQAVRDNLAYLAKHSVISRTGPSKKALYGKVAHVAANKEKILKFARKPDLAKKVPTKRRPEISVLVSTQKIAVPSGLVKARHLTIDDIDNFSAVVGVVAAGALADELSEDQFKSGIQKIVGEPGVFKDWGGEASDLMTTRLLIKGKRLRAAFAFKGPGLKTKLVIAKMGKNGDQCPRLFQEPADIFIVQHCREIVPAVIKLVEVHAQLKSVYENREILFCIIDGKDSKRLALAYPAEFNAGK